MFHLFVVIHILDLYCQLQLLLSPIHHIRWYIGFGNHQRAADMPPDLSASLYHPQANCIWLAEYAFAVPCPASQ